MASSRRKLDDEHETQFVPRSDDDEVLWTVEEITAERGNKYKVRWAGIDPATNKPWAQSWVHKHDCTDDLVVDWKAKKKLKAMNKRGGRTSTASRASSSSKRAGTGSSVSVKKTRRVTDEARSSRVSPVEEDGSEGWSPPPPKPPQRSKLAVSKTNAGSESQSRSRSPDKNRKQRLAVLTEDEDEMGVRGDEPIPPPLTPAAQKRKRHVETPAMTAEVVEVEMVSSPVKKRKRILETPEVDEVEMDVQGDEGDTSARPRKKQRTVLEELLLPPLSSDEEDLGQVIERVDVRKEVSRETNGVSGGVRDEEERSMPKDKAKDKDKSLRPVDSGSKAGGSSRASETRERKVEVLIRRERRVPDADLSEAEEEILPSTSKDKPPFKGDSPPLQGEELAEEVDAPSPAIKFGPPRGVKRREKTKESSGEQTDRLIDKEVDTSDSAIKFGPPRGAKRQEKVKESGSRSKGGSSRTNSVIEHVPTKGQPENGASSGTALSRKRSTIEVIAPSASPVPAPVEIPNSRTHIPVLSPRALARLELFDRMMAEVSEAPPPTISKDVPHDNFCNYDDTNDPNDNFETFDPLPPRPASPPLSNTKMKRTNVATPNGLVVPETESSGHSQNQTGSLLKPPLSPHRPPSSGPAPCEPPPVPNIAVIAPSAPSSFVSPRDLTVAPQKPHSSDRPSKKPTFKHVPQVTANMFRETIKARPRAREVDAPPSSIESFASPKRVDKGKQRAVEDDGFESSLSEDAGDNRKGQITDSALKKRGQELFDRIQFSRETERQKKKKAKQLKTVSEIVNGTTVHSQTKGSPLPVVGDAETTVEMSWEDVIDLTGGGNSATLDTTERSERKPHSQKDTERLRIELRQEEEESTQEAAGVYPPPPLFPVKKPEVANGEDADARMPPPKSPKNSPVKEQMEVDHVEQPSTDLQHASVIVQVSQGQRHEDTDHEPLPANRPTSTPPRPIPENLTDSPKRRLGEALSLLNVKSEEIQRLECELADARKNMLAVKAELDEARHSSEPTPPVRAAWEAERAQWTQDRSKWSSDLSAWQAERKEMSEEKTRLVARVAELSDAAVRVEEASAKLSELEAGRVAWTEERIVMQNDMTQRSEELAAFAKVRGEHDQERSKWEVERAERIEEKAKWETERTALQEKQETLSRSVEELTASVESLASAKASAERDSDFFRGQYMQASAFVSSVQQENVELENRTKIAEGQAQEGVAAIKAMFEGRVKAMQDDIDRWKSLADLLQEKDQRTNDAVRLRAALVPELQDHCHRLTVEKEALDTELRKLSRTQQRGVVQRNKLYYQILKLKKERASLKSKLMQLVKMTEGNSTQQTSQAAPAPPPVSEDEHEGIDPNDMDVLPEPTPHSMEVSFDEPSLFPCMWRPDWRDQCQQIFDTKEDLERHIREHFRDLVAR